MEFIAPPKNNVLTSPYTPTPSAHLTIMSITLTKSAAHRIKSRLQSTAADAGLRLSVKNSGCSGLAYNLDYADEIAPTDRVFESHGVKVIVAPAHLEFLDGTEIDYIEEGLSAVFHFKNPNVTDQCGCGESFTVN